MKRWLTMAVAGWILLVALPSIPSVRVVVAKPLFASDTNASGDACYVLAGSGGALAERLLAASDLYHLHRVARVILMRNDATSYYNFVARASWTSTDWTVDALTHHGVPADKIVLIAPAPGVLGTLAEARNVAATLPADVKRLVLVSSAPHMRRSVLTFRRILPPAVSLVPYAATDLIASAELDRPIWLEYLKLGGYAIVAW